MDELNTKALTRGIKINIKNSLFHADNKNSITNSDLTRVY